MKKPFLLFGLVLLLGGGTYDHCKSLNAFAMTDEELRPSAVIRWILRLSLK